MTGVFGDGSEYYANRDVYAIDADGAVYVWSDNAVDIALGDERHAPKEPVRVNALDGKRIVSISVASGQ